MKSHLLCIVGAATLILGSGGAAVSQQPIVSNTTVTTNGFRSTNADRPLRLETELVTMTVTVNDNYGRCVTGLESSHFEVYDNKVRQQIAFFSNEDAPATVGIIYDLSGSMKERVQKAHHALRRFLDYCHPEDEFFVIGYNDRPQLVRDFARDPASVANSLTLVSPEGRTALYDAVYLGIQKARQGAHNRKVLVVISDGQDNASRYTYKELERTIQESDVMVYTIGITNAWDMERYGLYGRWVLDRVASMSGGDAYFPESDQELMDVCALISTELRAQYSIGYYPSAKPEQNEYRKLKVKLQLPNGLPRLTARTRNGYRAGS